MSASFELFFIIAVFLMLLSIILICKLIINKVATDYDSKLLLRGKVSLLDALFGIRASRRQTKKSIDTTSYYDMKQSIQLDKLKRIDLERNIDIQKSEKKHIRRLKSIFETRRIEAAVHLGLIGTGRAREELEKSIKKEQSFPVKLYMANALSEIADPSSIPFLIASLENSHRWYRDRVNMLISDYGESLNSYLPQIIRSERIEIMELIVDFSADYYSELLKDYLVGIVDTKEETKERLFEQYGSELAKCCAKCIHGTKRTLSGNRDCKYKGEVKSEYLCHRFKLLPVSVNVARNHDALVYRAANVIAEVYPKTLDDPKYLNSKDVELKNVALKALATFTSQATIEKLFYYLKYDDTQRSVVYSISKIIERNPEYINSVAEIFNSEKEISNKRRLAEILAGRLEYFIMKLGSNNSQNTVEIIREILLLGRTSETIDFLNKNKDLDIENELIAIIKEVIPTSKALEDEFKAYLNERLAKKCGFVRVNETPAKREEKRDLPLIRKLYLILAALVIMFPVIYVVRHFDTLLELPLIEHAIIFVIDFNYYLAYYSITINLVYIALLILSAFQVRKQLSHWKVKNTALLFKKRMLPSVSIIAPAYNEEKTIIESANSLLNLKYPDYELIIVNDGSRDTTLDVLIKYFDLIRVDYIFEYKLKTKLIRGVYMNRSMPKLIVVDKYNGGKADSLNAGINISSKEYFCGIDADSLLEDEALLKLASLTLDHGLETPAMGGNIFPINGCTVERGQITSIKIPGSKLAKFQTIEYIRAFMTGRLGWAALNSLLIISGAFGLFRKERVISIGGYLTSSGKYAKDTVGEDMELVVRISRLMRELGQKYRIDYSFNANCWTEVPEDMKSLKKQRHRWHRGLIDILTFHKVMLFNPRYGRTGMLAMPYFLIFEMIGPMIEFQGYLMVITAIILGLLNAEIALLLFISTILMGMIISISSLLIAEKDLKYFKLKDILILLGFSIIENFGPRQLFSFWRVGGYLSMLGKQKGWGKPERKGFATSKASAKV